jgi:ribosomal-protein-alanine N-acetyltransferase
VNAGELLAALIRSRDLHRPWVDAPLTSRAVAEYLAVPPTSTLRYALREAGGELAGVVNVSAIVRGAFHSAYLGFYALVPHQARGLLRQAIKMVIASAFSEHELHRLEANVQPANLRSASLVRGLGFRLEGHSPRYLKIGGAWRDHDRYALTVEEWNPEASAPKGV